MPHTAHRLASPAMRAVEKTDEEIADLIVDLDIEQTIDLGGAMMHLGRHAILGAITVICSATGAGALIEASLSPSFTPELQIAA